MDHPLQRFLHRLGAAAVARTRDPRRRRRRRRSHLLAIATVAAVASSGCQQQAAARSIPLPTGGGDALPATVRSVVDGDTVVLAFDGHPDEHARLLGIDTPETVKPNTPVQCFGPEASARTKALLPAGTSVLVQRDEEARDRYGRILVYLWRRRDGLFVNRSLVDDGFARTLSIEPNTAHRSELSAAAAGARTGEVGLWGRCPAEPEGP